MACQFWYGNGRAFCGTAASGVTLEFSPSMLIENVRSDQSSSRLASCTSSAACPAE